jgi:hypothetical protein
MFFTHRAHLILMLQQACHRVIRIHTRRVYRMQRFLPLKVLQI